MNAPLNGLKVVELGGIGPVPHAGMMLADMGADVVSVSRPGVEAQFGATVLARGKRSLAIDLKSEQGREAVLDLVAASGVIVEGFRPGVAERLGLGPEECHRRNPGVVYGRMTGWGQDGPLAGRAGHDIDYIAVSGALSAVGPPEQPLPPLNLVGDFGGGSMLLVAGVLAALWSGRERQVVDAAMVDGSALLTAMHHAGLAAGWWTGHRGGDLFDGSAPFYTTYRTADGEWMAVGALEPQFYQELLTRLGLEDADLPAQMDREGWPEIRRAFAEVFASRSRGEWEVVFAESDACVVGVYSLRDAPSHPHNRARSTFIDVGGVVQPAPAPRFGAPRVPGPIPAPGQHTREILVELGRTDEDLADLTAAGVVSPG